MGPTVFSVRGVALGSLLGVGGTFGVLVAGSVLARVSGAVEVELMSIASEDASAETGSSSPFVETGR